MKMMINQLKAAEAAEAAQGPKPVEPPKSSVPIPAKKPLSLALLKNKTEKLPPAAGLGGNKVMKVAGMFASTASKVPRIKLGSIG